MGDSESTLQDAPRLSTKNAWKRSPIGLGILLGAFLSIIPWEFGFLFILIALPIWFSLSKDSIPRFGTRWAALGLLSCCATLLVALLIPVKHLDQKVAPLHYERMPLSQLTQKLRQDWRVMVRAPLKEGTNVFIAFETSRTMTQRDVLNQLARDTGMDLRIGYCGTGATFLFGGYPCFTYLISPKH